jgi:hypothetical protein
MISAMRVLAAEGLGAKVAPEEIPPLGLACKASGSLKPERQRPRALLVVVQPLECFIPLNSQGAFRFRDIDAHLPISEVTLSAPLVKEQSTFLRVFSTCSVDGTRP